MFNNVKMLIAHLICELLSYKIMYSFFYNVYVYRHVSIKERKYILLPVHTMNKKA